MANIKSAKKRVLIAEANRQRNAAFKTSIKTALKKALALAEGDDKEALNAAILKHINYATKLFLKVFYTKILLQERNQDLFLLSKN